MIAPDRIRTRAWHASWPDKESAPSLAPAAIRQRVLVVEDDVDLRQLIASSLRRGGFDVLDCDSARAAVRQRHWSRAMSGHAGSIDVVVTDLCLGEIDGLALLRRIADAGVDVPVVLISGFAGPAARAKATRLGAAAFLDKPVAMPELLRLVQQLARERTRRVRTGGSTPTPRRAGLRVVH